MLCVVQPREEGHGYFLGLKRVALSSLYVWRKALGVGGDSVFATLLTIRSEEEATRSLSALHRHWDHEVLGAIDHVRREVNGQSLRVVDVSGPALWRRPAEYNAARRGSHVSLVGYSVSHEMRQRIDRGHPDRRQHWKVR